jgi:hypothetical protein
VKRLKTLSGLSWVFYFYKSISKFGSSEVEDKMATNFKITPVPADIFSEYVNLTA